MLQNFVKKAKLGDLCNAKFKVCFVAHSHLDLGWLVPYSSYFGSKFFIALLILQATYPILENTLNSLSKFKRRKFILDNLGYLKPYYEAIDVEQRANIHKLIDSGQFVITNAASVSSHDTATNYFLDMISNIQAGANWLESKFQVAQMKKLSSYSSA